MRFPNMGDEQNIEGRFLGLCSKRSVVRLQGCTAVCDFMVKFMCCGSFEGKRWALFSSFVSKAKRSHVEAEYCRDGLRVVSFEICRRILYRYKLVKLVSLCENKVALRFLRGKKNAFCNQITYSLADAILHNLIFTQGVLCDLEMYAVQYGN